MAKRGRKKAKDQKGYLDSNKKNETPYKVIQGDSITMEGVSGNIYAVPFYKGGKSGKGILMKPGENHKFDGATHVIEVPEKFMQGGGGIQNEIKTFYNYDDGTGFRGTERLELPEGMDMMEGAADLSLTPSGNQPQVERLNYPEGMTEQEAMADKSFIPSGNQDMIQPDINLPDTDMIELENNLIQSKEDSQFLNKEFDSINKEQNEEYKKFQKEQEQNYQNSLEDVDKIMSGDNYNNIESGEKIQFANPYGGVDIPTASNILGESLAYDGDKKGANTARGVASGLKVLSGLGRNIMSGYSRQKKNQFVVDEANSKIKDSLKKTEYAQEGGNIKSNDVDNIKEATDIDFTLEGARDLFAHVPTEQGSGQELSFIDFGKYKDVGYFEQTGMSDGKPVISNTSKNPMNYADNQRNAMNYLRELNDGNIVFDYKPSTQPKPNETEVASLQKGGKVKASDLLTEQFITGNEGKAPHNVETEKGEYAKDNQTGKVKEIVGKKHTQGGEKMQLDDHKVLSDHTKIGGSLAKKYRDEFDVKVKAKDTYATVLDKVQKKIGLNDKTKEYSNIIEQIEKEQERTDEVNSEATTGLNLQFLSGKAHDINQEIESLEPIKQSAFDMLYADQEGKKPKEERDEDTVKDGGLIKELSTKYNIPEDKAREVIKKFQGGGDTSHTDDVSRKRFIDFYNQSVDLGYKGDADPNAENLDAEAAKLQQFMVENHPEEVISYSKGNRLTAKGVNTIRESMPDAFNEAGLDPNKKAGDYSDEELEKLSRVIEGDVDNNFWLSQFNDGLWRYRAPMVATQLAGAQTYDPTIDVKPIDMLPTNNAGVTTEEETNLYTGDANTDKQQEGNKDNLRNVLLPNQYIMPPGAMQPHRMAEITPREMEAKIVSPERQIQEIRRQYQANKAEINNLPDSQRRAMLTKLNADTNAAINQAVSSTNRTNAQIEQNVEAQNVAAKSQADLYNEKAADNYEMKTLRAKDLTDTDIRNYFAALNKRNVANFNTVQNLNLMNQMYDNYNFDGMGGVEQIDGLDKDTSKAMANWSILNQTSDEEETKKKSSSKTKRGRK